MMLVNPFGANGAGVGGSIDPNFSSVVMLLHANGSSGSTTFVDNAGTPHTLTAGGTAQISTAQSKFGASSALFDGAVSTKISSSSSTDFDLPGDFTIEFWAWASATTASGGVVSTTNNGSATNGYVLELGNRGLVFSHAAATRLTCTTGGYADSTWHHWAITRSGGTLRGFKDGALLNSATYSTAITGVAFTVGGWNDGLAGDYFKGHIDDLRITKGAARYTAAFTAPSAQFPDS